MVLTREFESDDRDRSSLTPETVEFSVGYEVRIADTDRCASALADRPAYSYT